jgi:hypothetical protein
VLCAELLDGGVGATAQRRHHRRRTLLMHCDIGLRMPGVPPLFEDAIYGQRSRTAQDQRYEAGEI